MTISRKPQCPFGALTSVALAIAIAALTITGCSGQGNSSDARLIKVVGHYNIVRFNGNVYGAPHGVAIDWKKDDLKNVPGLIVGSSVNFVEKSIRSLPDQEENSSDAHLVKVIGHYNIVKFNGNVYGAPHGVAIDWKKDDLKNVPGLIIGTSLDVVEKFIPSPDH